MQIFILTRGAVAVIVATIVVLAPLAFVSPAEAAVSSWQKGVSIAPESTTDFASDAFKQALTNAANAGVTHVGLVIPYYQSNQWSTDLHDGWNTPTDAALIAAIEHAHSLGLKVMLKPHVELYTGAWRAYINPDDRNAWFGAYGAKLVHLAEIAQAENVDSLLLGTELVGMAAESINPTNTQQWAEMIADVRAVYSGKIAYNANSTSNNDSVYQNEKKFIKFWHLLDFVGLSVYYGLDSPTDSVADLKGEWDYWNDNDLAAFHAQVGKPLVFTEIGYRSLEGARYDPWNWERQGAADAQEQANLYEALLSYWNDYDYVQGVYWWEWEPNPQGGQSTWYTPQNKPAEEVMRQWFTNSPSPNPGNPTNATFTSSVSASGNAAGQQVTIPATVNAIQGALANGIIDIEVYDQNGTQVHQYFTEGQSIAQGSSGTFTTLWTPATAGTYRIAVGVFTGGWSQVLHWNNEAALITVTGGGTNPDPDPTTPPSSGQIDIWWPTNNASVSGVQPIKAIVRDRALNTYTMHWSVDNGSPVPMYDSDEGYPHKEAWIDVSGWRWRENGPYVIKVTATDSNGSEIGSATSEIWAY